MPEGHTIHRLARDHRKWLAGQVVTVSSPQGRFEAQAKSLSGTELKTVDAHGKHLFYVFEDKRTLHVHLGLYGKFRLFKKPFPEPRGAVRVRLVGNSHGFDLNGPNQCELLAKDKVKLLQARLGVDPLRVDSDPERLWHRLHRSKKQVGALLLDQSMIAGVGNIFRAEILFLLGIHPCRLAKDLSREEFDNLWSLAKRLLEIGVKYNRIITVPKQVGGKPLTRLSNEERVHIYKKESCPKCYRPVEQIDSAGRSLYFCSYCQPH